MPLFVVATPIGNLEDLSFRALRTLKEVDLIAAEDTRRTAKLLAHYEIRKPVVSLREHNEVREAPKLLARLESGLSIALVSDAGTPGISDPGAKLVRAARDRGIKVVPIPGPNAIAAALSASGIPVDEFVFMGFPPRGGEARQEWLSRLGNERRTVVFFESPHRINRTLQNMNPILVKRPHVVARELTKAHEELVESPTIIADRGEFTVVVSPMPDGPRRDAVVEGSDVYEMLCRLTEKAGFDETTAAKLTALAFEIDVRTVAKIAKKQKIWAKQQNLSVS
jgi:16S rRNA (cytidine1402-2'-O)-methyltransferase